MSTPSAPVCSLCGAAPRDGRSCREQFRALLALEYEDPATYGVVHHLTVLCYLLQHPYSYSDEALDWVWTALEGSVTQGWTADDLRRRARQLVDAGTSGRGNNQPAHDRQQIAWPVTVADVFRDDPRGHRERVWTWARSILAHREQGLGSAAV